MIALITADAAIAVACLALAGLLAWLRHRHRGILGRPGRPLLDVPAEAVEQAIFASPLNSRAKGATQPALFCKCGHPDV
jgi:uncharacterized iron-regulated membrane protein